MTSKITFDRVNVVMPMLGKGERMRNLQDTCKPLYKLPDGKPLFLRALESLNQYSIYNLVLVILLEYAEEFREYLPKLEEMVDGEVKLVEHESTECQVESFLIGLKEAGVEDSFYPVISLDCDIYAELPLIQVQPPCAGMLFGFRHSLTNKAYFRTEGEYVTEIREKVRISPTAVFGAYVFFNTEAVYDAVENTTCRNMSDIFNYLLLAQYNVGWMKVDNVWNYGTIEEWKRSTARTKTYKGLLFDFDGTLFDTKELNYKAYQLAYYDLGIEITPEMFAKTDGLSVYDFNRAMGVECNIERLRELKAKYYQQFVLWAKPNEYLLKLVKKYYRGNNNGIQTALVTTARFTNIRSLLEEYDLMFDSLVTQEDVVRHKPAPDCYELALERMGLNPEECLAFEDSRAGFVAARQAGIDCVMVNGFYDDCVADMSGGSDATTKLLCEGGQLIVVKEASGKNNVQRLRNQCDKLLAEANNSSYIDVLDSYESEDGEYFRYTMPYMLAPSAYEYINKMQILPEIVEVLANNAHTEFEEINKQDIRKDCWDKYIAPGMQIYEEVVGKPLPTVYSSAEYIPEFVNNFRITPYHGDSTLENILIDRNGKVLLIDPVPDGNVVRGLVHDYSKLGQSLAGYEVIRDGGNYTYNVERRIFDDCVRWKLSTDEYNSLKFHTACLLFRRLKHQVEQNPNLVKPYGDLAWHLLNQFAAQEYRWEDL